jgi:hypothetical protein
MIDKGPYLLLYVIELAYFWLTAFPIRCFLPSLNSFAMRFQRRRFLEIDQAETRIAHMATIFANGYINMIAMGNSCF